MNTSQLARKLSWLIAAILLLLPFHALLTTWIGSNTGHLDLIRIWKEILIVIMLPFGLWLALRDKTLRSWLWRSWLVRLIWLYILLTLILAGWSATQHTAVNSAIIYGLIINLRFFGFFLLCAVVAAHDNWLKRFWHYLLLGPAFVVTVFGLVQRFLLPYDFLKHFGYSPKTIPAYQTVDASIDFRRIQSTLRGANPLGAYLVPIITTLAAWRYHRRLLQVLTLIGALTLMYFSYSRSAWVGLAISLGLLSWWTTKHKRQTSQLVIAIGLLIFVAGGTAYFAHYNKTLQDTLFHTSSSSTSKLSSNAQRIQAIKNGFHDVVHQPLGRGVGTAGPASARNTGHPVRIAENYYLQLGQEVGVIGIFLFAAINILLARELWAYRHDVLAKILLASLVGISFINLVSHAWTDDTLSLIWWGLAGIMLGSILMKRRNNNAQTQKS